ncbi:hypothetical protein TorRG33x02_304450 [Trema orientale]|uniref:Uncharacterized protein n=1 Tax=Trema orientale TaxID=63057 RepID=A0A2P5BYC3_TREOI|nr:hypothetical protein TorRG33x02_304450 [Trema orientale]
MFEMSSYGGALRAGLGWGLGGSNQSGCLMSGCLSGSGTLNNSAKLSKMAWRVVT